MSNAPRIHSRVNRIMKKFMEKFPDLDLAINNWQFFNPETKKMFDIFEMGYKSCPSYSNDRNFVIGRLDSEGLSVEKMPRTHTIFEKAHSESMRLANEHDAAFIVMQVNDAVFGKWASDKVQHQKQKPGAWSKEDLSKLAEKINPSGKGSSKHAKMFLNASRKNIGEHVFRYNGSSQSGKDTYYKCSKCGAEQTITEPYAFSEQQKFGCTI